MKLFIPGGCLCGAVHFAIVAPPRTLYACHCSDCQTATGSAFVLAMRVPIDGITVTQGETKAFERSRSDGRKRNLYRCTKCLTALWSEALLSPEYLTVYAGTLDDTSRLEPVGHLWTSDALPWVTIPNGDLVFTHGAPDMKLFEDAWSRREAVKSRE